MRRKTKPYSFENKLNIHQTATLLWRSCSKCNDQFKREPVWTWWDDDKKERLYACFDCIPTEQALVKRIMALRP